MPPLTSNRPMAVEPMCMQQPAHAVGDSKHGEHDAELGTQAGALGGQRQGRPDFVHKTVQHRDEQAGERPAADVHLDRDVGKSRVIDVGYHQPDGRCSEGALQVRERVREGQKGEEKNQSADSLDDRTGASSATKALSPQKETKVGNY